ncbi:MAG TPA: acyl-CoA carboxylase epsilon subunit [Streptosporangiaceae bacterium]|nr:acyl-CoA carboxylase epsilon subunit [Streptosporangiaceae bacterium]
MPNKAPGALPPRQPDPAAPHNLGPHSPAPDTTAASNSTTDAATGTRPFISVVRGQPTEAELAAVVTVLAARAAAAAAVPAPERASRSSWSDASRLMREPVVPGQGAWRRSALPR